ncbi:MAG: UDP-3-O-(3-hydroxymyristoyl)glucosamine N-acyltransferase [Candidatus Baltobacteraceae bacterium]|jgi:UDP-3-O-[3-hydroxymyristoyl] glucosamine N-acyltransferase
MTQTLAELARRVGGEVRGDGEVEIDSIAAIDDTDARTLTFAVDERYLRAALASRAGAVLTEAAAAQSVSGARKPLLVVASARLALAQLLAERELPRPGASRHPSAVVDESATIGEGVAIGPFVWIGPGAVVGDRTVLATGVCVGADARTGVECTFGPRAMLLDRCVAGDRVVLQAGAVIGSDGFGYVFVDGAHRKIPQLGDVVLADDVEIGANTCIDRAQTGSTSVGAGTKIDNLVQIGHNCHIGARSAFAAQTGLAGSTVIGDDVLVGGQSAFKGHITVGSRVRIAGATHVWGDIPDGAFVSGRPAQPHADELRKQVRLRALDKLYARVAALEQR